MTLPQAVRKVVDNMDAKYMSEYIYADILSHYLDDCNEIERDEFIKEQSK